MKLYSIFFNIWWMTSSEICHFHHNGAHVLGQDDNLISCVIPLGKLNIKFPLLNSENLNLHFNLCPVLFRQFFHSLLSVCDSSDFCNQTLQCGKYSGTFYHLKQLPGYSSNSEFDDFGLWTVWVEMGSILNSGAGAGLSKQSRSSVEPSFKNTACRILWT